MPLVEKSSKPTVCLNFHWRFQLSNVSEKNRWGELKEPLVETNFHWWFSLHNRQWKWSIFTDGWCNYIASYNLFHWRFSYTKRQ
jgi:hypothetical protein